VNPKFLFSVVALAVPFSLIALTACDSDTSSNPSSEGAKSGFQCDVSRSGNSVHVIESYQGLVHEVTIEVSLDDDGHKKADITEKVTYPDASAAQRMCAEEKEEASYNQNQSERVDCDGNTVTSYFVERDDLEPNEYQAYRQERCAKMRKAAERGELE
jgi:hypothetical protein